MQEKHTRHPQMVYYRQFIGGFCVLNMDPRVSLLLIYSRDPQISTIPVEFSSNNQTHLRKLIRVFKIIIKSQVGEFDPGWS